MRQAIFMALVTALGLSFVAPPAVARWRPEYASAPQDTRDWYENAELTKPAAARMGFKSCCAKSDVVHTQFRVDKATGADEWYWLDRGTWKRIKPDIIHWGEHAPDGQPTLFLLSSPFNGFPAGTPTCFWPPESGN